MYGDFVEVFSKAKGETLPLHRSIAINLEPGYNLPYGRIYNFSELGGAIFTQLRGIRSRAQEAGSYIWILDLKIPCHMDGSMSGYFLMMDDMSPDYGTAMKSQWKTDIMEVSKDDL